MQVTLWYFADCPNWQLAEQRLRQALTDTGHADAEVLLIAVESEADAAAVGFAGSPTFTVYGVDLFDTTAATGALACRVYPTSHGLAGVPDTADLVAALTGHATT
ncbi:hypothetical protein ABZS66_34940 [Dactylosporangium sp. NPDC005572]|uniref:hypothetical protein n=1 Tax=Dactylosporangium sp. NPDC005572 TaxID=3156889 RepID=UPI0033BF4FDE